ncbi:MAG: formate/nitrite transporter family protein [Lachnospiraceae bacterium]|nr:formate/nitrite transporter family protein [Lachnospiraceae bacterium]MBQ8601168.1 formate/nitrite transporter family protein [Bacteroides sp.]
MYGVFIKAILSGFMIAFGCIIYLMCPNKMVGALLFSFGLLTIVCRELYLFTGKIGYIRQVGIVNILLTILGNFVGTYIIGTVIQLTRLPIAESVSSVVSTKLNDSIPSLFILSIACGVMMYLAVDSYKKSRSWLFVILPVVIFILSGFEHSIANMCYFTLANAWEPRTFLLIGVMILGNAVGSWIMNLGTYFVKE